MGSLWRGGGWMRRGKFVFVEGVDLAGDDLILWMILIVLRIILCLIEDIMIIGFVFIVL